MINNKNGANMVVYKITNTKTNFTYIGFTKFNIDTRWAQHLYRSFRTNNNIKFDNAIRKYGPDCWTKEIICEVNTHQEAVEREIHYIQFYNTYEKGYNSTKGGDGNNEIKQSKEANESRSKKLKGVKKSDQTIEKFKQRKQTDKTKAKIAASHKGMKKPWVKWTKEQCKQRGMTRRKINKEQYDQIHDLRNQKFTIVEIAKKVSLSADLVKKWLKLEW
jgi:hypothetical protein